MDATAELQHVIREARHDAWSVREGALLLLEDLGKISYTDIDTRRRVQVSALHQACKASYLFAQLDNAPTCVLEGLMRVVSIDSEDWRFKVRGGGIRHIGERDAVKLAEFAKQHGLTGESHDVWEWRGKL